MNVVPASRMLLASCQVLIESILCRTHIGSQGQAQAPAGSAASGGGLVAASALATTRGAHAGASTISCAYERP